MRGELISIDVIKHELQKRLDSLVLQLYPAAKLDSSKHNFCLGSLSGEAGQSLRIARTSTKLGWWKDFSSGEGGDVLSLVNRALGHRDMTETIKSILGTSVRTESNSVGKLKSREPARVPH